MSRLQISFHSMRSRIAVALTVMVTLLAVVAGYAVWQTFDEGLRMRGVRATHEQVYVPTVGMVAELQRERRLTRETAADETAARHHALSEQRAATDRAVDTFRARAGHGAEESSRWVDAAIARLSKLDSTRREFDVNGSGERAARDFTAAIESALLVLDTMSSNEVPQVGGQQRTLTALQHARESLARQGALLSGVLAGGGDLNARDYRTFVALNGAADSWLATVRAQVQGGQREHFQAIVDGDAFEGLHDMVSAVDVPAANRDPQHVEAEQPSIPFTADEWNGAVTAVLKDLHTLDSNLAEFMVNASTKVADALLWRAWVITGGGALLIVILIVVWVVVAPKHVVGALAKLRRTTMTFADRLPGLVKKLEDGKPVDLEEAARPVEFGPDEFGDVGRGINHLMTVAVQSTVSAREQKNSRDVIAALARRHQDLITEQLKVLTAVQNDVQDPDLLQKLFALDQRVTQTRRYNYNLLILAGDPLPRLRKRPVLLWDVMRSATQEVTHYQRVEVRQVRGVALVGPAYADVTHLLAELIENATVFSPPHTTVTVTGGLVTKGFVIEVEDSGVGMSEEVLARHNERLSSPLSSRIHPDVTQLGMFVVSRLAANRDVKVTLRRSPYGGTSAVVLIPSHLLTDASPDISINEHSSRPVGGR